MTVLTESKIEAMKLLAVEPRYLGGEISHDVAARLVFDGMAEWIEGRLAITDDGRKCLDFANELRARATSFEVPEREA